MRFTNTRRALQQDVGELVRGFTGPKSVGEKAWQALVGLALARNRFRAVGWSEVGIGPRLESEMRRAVPQNTPIRLFTEKPAPKSTGLLVVRRELEPANAHMIRPWDLRWGEHRIVASDSSLACEPVLVWSIRDGWQEAPTSIPFVPTKPPSRIPR